ncbi:MAG: threonine--tRNA ligase [Nanoarchaeota archaeon]
MIKITFIDGQKKEYEAGVTAQNIAESISQGLARMAIAAKVNNKLVDLTTTIDKNSTVEIITAKSQSSLHILRHTTAHILAHAVLRLYPKAKITIGPVIEDGFYYDIDCDELNDETLEKIEKEMQKIIKEDLPIKIVYKTKEEALEFFKDNKYKKELIEAISTGDLLEEEQEDIQLGKNGKLKFYQQGNFKDLCRGPHLPKTGLVKAFKLEKVTKAYWRGNSNNKQLARIYGNAFWKKSDMDKYYENLQEALKRDHNVLGRKMDIFTTSESVGRGLPLFKPKGAKMFQILQRFVEDEEEKRGYKLTKTPFMAKKDLYEISGHWAHYKNDMFVLKENSTEFAFRPMTCPYQFQIYKSKQRSYRDLPLRYNETSTLFRNEKDGELHGLIRLRQFTISEAHLIVRPEQLEDEFKGVLDLINHIMVKLGIEKNIWYQFSKWDPKKAGDKYIDNPEMWEHGQAKMKKILDELKLDYVEAEGEAAYYGPKLDIQFKNVFGKEDTIITVQIDFALPERFDMTYNDENGQKMRPIVIHRTSIGCYERTIAMLIEHFAGKFPLWINPVQIAIINVADRHIDYCNTIKNKLVSKGFLVEVNYHTMTVGNKIRLFNDRDKPNYMLILGDKDVESKTISARTRKLINGKNEVITMKIDDFIDMITKERDNKEIKEY